jgi:hypothetical protein
MTQNQPLEAAVSSRSEEAPDPYGTGYVLTTIEPVIIG